MSDGAGRESLGVCGKRRQREREKERERARVPGSVRIIRRLRFNSEVVRLVLSKCTDRGESSNEDHLFLVSPV